MLPHSDESRHVRLVDIVLWSIVGALLIAAAASAVGILQREVYSPRGLVAAYLGALAGHDVPSALALPGVADGIRKGPEASRELLRSDALGTLADVRIVSDDEFGTGRHRVTAEYLIDGRTASSSFMVEPGGVVAGVFTQWRFAASPLGVLRVTVEHATTFTAAGHVLDARAAVPDDSGDAFSAVGDYLVFAPSRYVLGHSSALLEARSAETLVTRPGAVTSAHVVALPTETFTRQVREELAAFLDRCATQHVLQPAGCPFGTVIDDRVVSDPQWSIVKYPDVELGAGSSSWQSPPAMGTARIRVEVQSLFDGSIEHVDREEQFVVALQPITIDGEGVVHIQLAAVD